jgi:protein gp37
MTVQFKPRTGGRGIEWCDETRNVTGGCMHECRWEMPDGTTAICYAESLAENGVASAAYPHGFKHHYWRPEQLKALAKGKDPLLIFCDSMSDLFAPAVPEEQVRQILAAMKKSPHHTYQSLTKAAPQLLKYLDDLPPNLWVGVSSPPDWMMGKRLNFIRQVAMLKRSLEVLRTVRQVTGNIVWMSAEPVSWDLSIVIREDHPLDWIVIGAASSGPRYFMPDPDHIDKLLQVLDLTKTPVFYKGNLGRLIESNNNLGRWREDFPTHYRDGSPISAVARRQRECDKHGWTKIALPTIQP